MQSASACSATICPKLNPASHSPKAVSVPSHCKAAEFLDRWPLSESQCAYIFHTNDLILACYCECYWSVFMPMFSGCFYSLSQHACLVDRSPPALSYSRPLTLLLRALLSDTNGKLQTRTSTDFFIFVADATRLTKEDSDILLFS